MSVEAIMKAKKLVHVRAITNTTSRKNSALSLSRSTSINFYICHYRMVTLTCSGIILEATSLFTVSLIL